MSYKIKSTAQITGKTWLSPRTYPSLRTEDTDLELTVKKLNKHNKNVTYHEIVEVNEEGEEVINF